MLPVGPLGFSDQPPQADDAEADLRVEAPAQSTLGQIPDYVDEDAIYDDTIFAKDTL